MVRQLAPERVAGSCDQCQPTDLLPANQAAFEIAVRFPGIFPAAPFGGHRTVNYDAAIEIARLHGLPDVLFFLEQMEAIAKGLNVRRQN